MKIRNLYIIVVLAGIAFSGSAQQLTFQSQYLNNHFLLNPAAAGSVDYIPIATSFRQQWAGFNDAPRTQMVAAHANIAGNMGVGAIIYNDVTGPLRNIGFQGSYAYQLELDHQSRLAFGLAMSLDHYTLDGNAFILNDDVDNTLNGAQVKSFNPDASFGAYYYGQNYFAGLSVMQLFQLKYKFGDEINELSRQVRHYYLNGGYKFELGGDFMLEPSALIKFVPNTPFQFDINATLFYKENLWAGLSYRHGDAGVLMLGVKRDEFRIGYSYDYTISGLQNYSAGTHEIYLEYQLGNNFSSPSFGRR